MTPYWAAQTGKDQFEAMQLSARTGKLHCQLKGNRVLLSGQAQTYLIGEIFI